MYCILDVHRDSSVKLRRHFFDQKIAVVAEIAAGMARLSLEFGKEGEGFFGGALVDGEDLGFLGKLSTYKQTCR